MQNNDKCLKFKHIHDHNFVYVFNKPNKPTFLEEPTLYQSNFFLDYIRNLLVLCIISQMFGKYIFQLKDAAQKHGAPHEMINRYETVVVYYYCSN